MNSAQETDSFFFQIVLKIAGNNTYCRSAGPELYNGIRICTSLCLHMAKRSNTYNVFSPKTLYVSMISNNLLLTKIYHSWEWRHMSVMASQTTSSSTVCSKNIQAKIKKNKATHYWPSLRGIHQLLVDSLDSLHNAESVSISWRHHVQIHLYSVIMT